jgi:hypothetical protein
LFHEERKRKMDKPKGKWMRVREKDITAEKERKEEQYCCREKE